MGADVKLKGRLKTYIMLPVWLTVPFAALAVIICFCNLTAGFWSIFFVAVYFALVMVFFRRSRRTVLNEMIDFATHYGTIQRRLLDEFEVPYAILDQNARLMWMNRQFCELTGKARNYHSSITGIFPQITKERISKEPQLNVQVTKDERIFRASIGRIDFSKMIENSTGLETDESDQFLTIMYLFDETLQHQYLQEKQDMQMVPALVYIDNYEEILDSVEEVKQSLLVALVDRKVNKYFAGQGGLVKKTENDKYFIVFPHKSLDEMAQDNFSLLEDVKSLKVGNEMAVTLSMGIGDVGSDYAKNYGYSRMAIDLALGRGGDQAVIKTKDKTFYYGGASRQVDKTTRVKARVKALALREIMISRDKFYIMGHHIMDIDSLGAAIGIFCAARQLGKQAQIVLDTVTTTLRPFRECFVPEKGYPEDMFISCQDALEEINSQTALVVVDTNRPSYTECPELLTKARTIVVFDHHRHGEEVIRNTDLSYIEPYSSSACEMIAEVLQYFDEDIKLSATEADAIYAGILVDTSNFMTKTGVRTFEAAAYLRRCGAETTRVRKMMRNDMNAYKARAEAIRHTEVYRGSYAVSICPADNIENPTVACAQAANELLNITGIKASFVLTEYNGKIYISARSIDEINVQQIMERLGGGGHMNSAGAQLTGCTVLEARRTIENTLDEMLDR